MPPESWAIWLCATVAQFFDCTTIHNPTAPSAILNITLNGVISSGQTNRQKAGHEQKETTATLYTQHTAHDSAHGQLPHDQSGPGPRPQWKHNSEHTARDSAHGQLPHDQSGPGPQAQWEHNSECMHSSGRNLRNNGVIPHVPSVWGLTLPSVLNSNGYAPTREVARFCPPPPLRATFRNMQGNVIKPVFIRQAVNAYQRSMIWRCVMLARRASF